MSKIVLASVFVALTVLTFCKAAPVSTAVDSPTSTAIDTLTEQYAGRVKRQGGGGCGCGCGCGCCGCGGGGGGGCGCCCCRPRCCCRRCCTCCRTCCCTRCCTCCRPCCCRPCCCCGCGGGGRKRRSLQTLAIKLAEKKSQEVQQLALPEAPAAVPENDNIEQFSENHHSHETAKSQ